MPSIGGSVVAVADQDGVKDSLTVGGLAVEHPGVFGTTYANASVWKYHEHGTFNLAAPVTFGNSYPLDLSGLRARIYGICRPEVVGGFSPNVEIEKAGANYFLGGFANANNSVNLAFVLRNTDPAVGLCLYGWVTPTITDLASGVWSEPVALRNNLNVFPPRSLPLNHQFDNNRWRAMNSTILGMEMLNSSELVFTVAFAMAVVTVPAGSLEGVTIAKFIYGHHALPWVTDIVHSTKLCSV